MWGVMFIGNIVRGLRGFSGNCGKIVTPWNLSSDFSLGLNISSWPQRLPSGLRLQFFSKLGVGGLYSTTVYGTFPVKQYNLPVRFCPGVGKNAYYPGHNTIFYF